MTGDYLLSLRSVRSTFSIGFSADCEEAALDYVIGLVVKARAPAGSTVLLVGPDGTELNISEVVAPHLDRPEL